MSQLLALLPDSGAGLTIFAACGGLSLLSAEGRRWAKLLHKQRKK